VNPVLQPPTALEAAPGGAPELTMGAPESSQLAPRLVIRPRRGLAALQIRELWEFRDLLRTFVVRDLKLRYRQTVLGVAWVVLQPLLGAAIFAVVFGRVARLPSGKVPYFLFAYAGLLAWNLFQSVLSRASVSLVGSGQLISKVYFPRLILPLSAVGSALVDFAVALTLMVIFLPLHGVVSGPALFTLPGWILLVLLLTLGLGCGAAALAVSYRDVVHVLPTLTQLLLYASPVAYAVAVVPESLRPLYFLNPLATLLEGFRWSLVGGPPPSAGYVAYAAVCCCVVFAAGILGFTTMERKFADVI
jgi:lipopolysaccharide transport system permease protein